MYALLFRCIVTRLFFRVNKMKTLFIIIILFILAIVVLYFILIGNIDKSGPKIILLEKPVQFAGLGIKTDSKNIYKDVGKVAARFNSIKARNPIPDKKEPRAFVAVSRDYNPDTGTFEYIVGDVVIGPGLIPEGLLLYEIPALTYAVFPVRPRSKLAWGITMGRMKRYIYNHWLPASGYEPAGLIDDFEWHDEKSLGKNPEISLYVAIREKQ